MAGDTLSIFPGTSGGANGGGYGSDIVLASFSADLTTLHQSTYVGGASDDMADAIAIDSAGKVLVAGISGSDNYPRSAGGAQPYKGGAYDIVVSRLTPDLKSSFCGDGVVSGSEECELDDVDGATCPAGHEGERVCNNDPAYPAGDATCTLVAMALTCANVDECTLGTDNCHDDAVCEDTDGSFTCECRPGYAGDGVTCSELDSCTLGADNCHDDATCIPADAGFTCECEPGFEGDGVTCVDALPPDTTLLTGPGASTHERTATFTFDSSEAGSSFACALDDAAFAPCSSPHAYSDLEEGTHTFHVRASDLAGNADPTPAEHVWAIDLPVCGDGVIDDGEGCDDGDADANDGCSADCDVEPGYACGGEPSDCALVIVDGGQEGDGGDTGEDDEDAGPPEDDDEDAGPSGEDDEDAGPSGEDDEDAGPSGEDDEDAGPSGEDDEDAGPTGQDDKDGGPVQADGGGAPASGCGCGAGPEPDLGLVGLALALLLRRRRGSRNCRAHC